MGSWGYAALEDDTALDWIGGFLESPSLEAIREALDGAISADFIDDYAGPRALAAAEVVAALNGKPFAKLNDQVAQWAGSQEAPGDELKSTARKAIQLVFEDSELREIWEDSDAIEPWGQALDELKSRLQ